MHLAISRQFALLAAAALAVLFSAGCSGQTGDPPVSKGIPAPGGKDLRLRDVGNPLLPRHAEFLTSSPSISGVIVTAVDTYDETENGKGTGTLYVQDIGAAEPYSGMSLFATTFNPGNLRVSVGDVLDLHGEYQEARDRGPNAIFPKDSVQAQIAFATASFRYETRAPQPLDLKLADLMDFANGRRWIGMLVRLTDVTAAGEMYTAASGRASIDIAPSGSGAVTGCNAPFPKAPQIVNDLMDLKPLNLKTGSKLKSVVGVVGFFCTIHLAPRSLADVKL